MTENITDTANYAKTQENFLKEGFFVYNNDKTFIFEMSVYNFAYSDLVNGYQEVVNEVQNSGITVTDVNEVSNGSTNIFLFDLNDGENVATMQS